MAGSAKHTQRTALVQLSQYNGDEHIFSGGMTGGVLTYDAGAGTGWSWRDAIGLNGATPTTPGLIAMRFGANGVVGLDLSRFTDTGPTGYYLFCRNAANTVFPFSVDVNGNLSATAVTASSLTAPLTGLTGTLAVAQGGTGDTGTPWTSYTPTVSAATGSFTSVSATGRWKTIGKTVFIKIVVTITTNGTAASYVIAGLPIGESDQFMIHGREMSVTGASLMGLVSGGSVTIMTTNTASYPGGTGYSLLLSGLYESV